MGGAITPTISLQVTGNGTYYTTGDIPTKNDIVLATFIEELYIASGDPLYFTNHNNYYLTFSFLEQDKTYPANTTLKFKLDDNNQLRQQE